LLSAGSLEGYSENDRLSTSASNAAALGKGKEAYPGAVRFGREFEGTDKSIPRESGKHRQGNRKARYAQACRMKRGPSEATLLLWDQLVDLHSKGYLDNIGSESTFYPGRKWRFDFKAENSKIKLGIEIDGGGWIRGRHNTGVGKQKDDEKFNHAALVGYRVLRFSPQAVLKGEAIQFIKRVLEAEP
jgi:very-short-patch-repair endonuclease